MFDIAEIGKWFRRTFSKRDIIIILTLLAGYLLTRLINLDKFPIFTDEGIYIHWAKVAWKDANWRFISLTDGKQPLHTWAMIPFLKIFSPNLLLGGRMFSVLSGLIAMLGIATTLGYLFNKKVAYVGALLYVVTPMFLFYDRMALADSAVNAGFIWMFFFSILLARTLRLDVALLYGLSGGLALLTKSSSQMFLGLSALSPVLFFKTIKGVRSYVNYYLLFIVVCTISIALYNIQRLSPFLHFVALKNTTFVMSFHEFLTTPFAYLVGNLSLIPYYVSSEMSYVLAVLGIIGVVMLWKKDWRLSLYILCWMVFSYIAIATFAKVIFPRYLIFFATLLTLGAAYLVSNTKNKLLITCYILLTVGSVIYFNYTLLFDFKNIPFPPVDRGQYIESINAGWGIKDIVQYAREKSKEKHVVILAEGNFGVVGDMLEASIAPGENMSVQGYWPLNEEQLFENQKLLKNNYVFVVYSHKRDGDFLPHWPIKLIQKYDKPGGDSSFHFFRLVEAL